MNPKALILEPLSGFIYIREDFFDHMKSQATYKKNCSICYSCHLQKIIQWFLLGRFFGFRRYSQLVKRRQLLKHSNRHESGLTQRTRTRTTIFQIETMGWYRKTKNCRSKNTLIIMWRPPIPKWTVNLACLFTLCCAQILLFYVCPVYPTEHPNMPISVLR